MKKEKTKVSKLLIGLSLVFLILAITFAVTSLQRVSPEEVDKRLDSQKTALTNEFNKGLNDYKAEVNKQVNELNDYTKTVVDKNADLTKQLEETQAKLSEATKPSEPMIVKEDSYKEDELELGAEVPMIVLSDTKLDKLLDSKVIFDGDDYNVEEIVSFSGMKISMSDDDYKGEARLEVPEAGILYLLSFDSALELEDIGVDDENLAVKFLGEDLIISSWEDNEITVIRGDELTLKEGDVVVVNDKDLKLEFVSETEAVSISYNGVKQTVKKGQTKNIGGLDVYCKEVLTNSREGLTVIRVGTDVKETYTDGDEYSKNSIFNWRIDGANKQLGVELNEVFKGYDEDEEFNALAYAQSLSLPNDYVKMTFDGLDKVDYYPIKMDVASKSGVKYVRMTGKFESGIEKYDKLYLSLADEKVYGLDEDNDLVELTDDVFVDKTDFELLFGVDSVKVVVKGEAVIRAEFLKDFSEAMLDTVVLSGDEKHLSTIGIVVENIEDSEEDEKFSFSIPEEVVKATISFI